MSSLQHEQVSITRGKRSGLTIIIAVHSSALGQAAGGCRMWTYASWRDGLDDALRLSEAMTLKCALAGLDHGGGKSVIVLPPGFELTPDVRRAAMLDFGDAVQALGGIYGAAEDVGTTADDMFVARERTEYAYCLPVEHGGIGDVSQPTATGLISAIRATCLHLYGDPEPKGRAMTVIGLGNVGSLVARALAEAGSTLTVSDINPAKRALAQELDAIWLDPEEALIAPADILVPAALGGIFTAQSVELLQCQAIVGPANNQLADDTVADLLAQRGILWAPDFLVNAGGVIFGALVDAGAGDPAAAMVQVEAIGDTLTEIFAVAARTGETPGAAAITLARARVAGA